MPLACVGLLIVDLPSPLAYMGACVLQQLLIQLTLFYGFFNPCLYGFALQLGSVHLFGDTRVVVLLDKIQCVQLLLH